ncbi:FAD-dependent oxidoreductase [Suttonella ornithocola]|uniref:3-(3-hydroxy-phenyl)propionate/3-hydroxycinnamic acid hydroxylase n=1 Tax=Suttonella ornithocola TaxID=279832 RepID=A0A380MS49_9GAMM|nr:FAD-dependent oxidoreductase [Suttonella ornithocola]SUO94167.1 3-(3-hydroxy-phenyl)propionate/3-hydroxycinnamic acid hydroxylase [Suttonella ornithocola]
MLASYQHPEYKYSPPPELTTPQNTPYPIAIIGAGPVGLTAALDCAKRGIRCVVLDDNNTVSIGSRALCYAKRSLEIWSRLGVADRMVAKGIKWQVGKNYFRNQLAYQFDLLPETGHEYPAMINLQQYYMEEYLVDALMAHPNADLRWKHKVIGITQKDNHVVLTVETPDGKFPLTAQYAIACDGASSKTRSMLGSSFEGEVFDDQFLIIDVIMKNNFPPERWFWFDPPFHPEQSALLHKSADNLWRIDFQLGRDANPNEWKQPKKVIPLLKQMLGKDCEFELEWLSVYKFACRKMKNFVHNRVIFAGDAAHQVSPFGARGANFGVQDIDNLIWKLQLILNNKAPIRLLESYDHERRYAADENIQYSTQSTDFISPKTKSSLTLRNAVLTLAKKYAFARPLVNSGRLSTATCYDTSPLNTADHDTFTNRARPGIAAPDAPIRINNKNSWLLRQLGDGFTLLSIDTNGTPLNIDGIIINHLVIGRDIEDPDGILTERYDLQPGTTYLIRPDQHIAARWRHYDPIAIATALRTAIGETVL